MRAFLMSISQRYILQQIGTVPLSQVNEKAFTVQISARLNRHVSPRPASRQDDFQEARERLSQELNREISTTYPMSAGWQRAPASDTRRGYIWRGLAVATFSVALISLTGYAFLSQSGGGVRDASQDSAPHEEAEAAKDDVKQDRVPVIAAVARIYTPSDERNDPVEAKPESLPNPPESLAKPTEEKANAKLAPQIEDIGPPEVVAAVHTITSLSKATEEALLQRASHQLNLEDISGARRTYEALAAQGSQRGALGLAETYDAMFLARHNVIGLKPDLRLARQWYEKAASLGSSEAAERLKILN
jgi:hypothetical protein